MPADRITDLFHLLQCTNTDIARFAGCSPSNISRLKSGLNKPARESRSVLRLAEGVYRYADHENLTDVLKELTGKEDTSAETLVPAIIGWLYETEDYELPEAITPRSRLAEEKQRQIFGRKLDLVMRELSFSNRRLAEELNVDASLASRYRSGACYPHKNEHIREKLGEILTSYAERHDLTAGLGNLCGFSPEELTPQRLTEWFCETESDTEGNPVEQLLKTIDTLSVSRRNPADLPPLPPIQKADRYWGLKGLRDAVIRFLVDSARSGDEMLLYSDEPMDWMSGEREYFAMWSALMSACVGNGVNIKIIHNVDRVGPEMADAITGWLPLYMSGRIEPYVFRRSRDARFYHTVFISPGRAAIYGNFPKRTGEQRWYDYLTDEEQLAALKKGFRGMLAGASPFLKIYPGWNSDPLRKLLRDDPAEKWILVSDGLPLSSMPEGLLQEMLAVRDMEEDEREKIFLIYKEEREAFKDMLARGAVDAVICLPNREAIGCLAVNTGVENSGLYYTAGEYAAHVEAVRELVENEKNYHLTLVPQAPFRELVIMVMKDSVAAVRSREPFAAFVFKNVEIRRAVLQYFESFCGQYASDRFQIADILEAESTAGLEKSK